MVCVLFVLIIMYVSFKATAGPLVDRSASSEDIQLWFIIIYVTLLSVYCIITNVMLCSLSSRCGSPTPPASFIFRRGLFPKCQRVSEKCANVQERDGHLRKVEEDQPCWIISRRRIRPCAGEEATNKQHMIVSNKLTLLFVKQKHAQARRRTGRGWRRGRRSGCARSVFLDTNMCFY